MKLDYGIVIYVIKQLLLKTNQNIFILKHINTKNNMVLLLKNVIFFTQTLILNDTIKNCREKYFHSFEYRCVYDISFTNMTDNEEVSLTFTFEYKKFKSQF